MELFQLTCGICWGDRVKRNLMVGRDVVCRPRGSAEPNTTGNDRTSLLGTPMHCNIAMLQIVRSHAPWDKPTRLSLRLNLSHFQKVSNASASKFSYSCFLLYVLQVRRRRAPAIECLLDWGCRAPCQPAIGVTLNCKNVFVCRQDVALYSASNHLRVDHSQLVHVDHTSSRFWLHCPQVGIVYRQLLAVLKSINSRRFKNICALVWTLNQLPEVPWKCEQQCCSGWGSPVSNAPLTPTHWMHPGMFNE